MEPKSVSRNFSGFNDLGARTGIDMRPTLLRVLTDLYVHRLSHTTEEERHYSELGLRLLDVVDVPTRVAIARRLARYPSPPLQVLRRLAADIPDVAAELRAHPLLKSTATPLDMQQTPAAQEKSPIVERSATGTASTIDAETAHKLNELLLTANAEERRQILLNADVGPFESGVRPASSGNPAVNEALERALLSGNREQFTHLLARVLQIPGDHAQRLVRDELGEPIVVAAKVLRMPRDVFYRILLFVNPSIGHSVERVHALAELYDAITVSAAEAILTIWQSLRRDERTAGKYQPYTWDDHDRRKARPGAAVVVPRMSFDRRKSDRRDAS
jgi:hypothetical protein